MINCIVVEKEIIIIKCTHIFCTPSIKNPETRNMDINISNFIIGGGISSFDKYILFVLWLVRSDNEFMIDVKAILSFSSCDSNLLTETIISLNSALYGNHQNGNS